MRRLRLFAAGLAVYAAVFYVGVGILWLFGARSGEDQAFSGGYSAIAGLLASGAAVGWLRTTPFGRAPGTSPVAHRGPWGWLRRPSRAGDRSDLDD